MADYLTIISVKLKDYLGVVTPHDIFVRVADSVTLATLVTQAQAYFALLDDVTDEAGISAHATIKFASTGLKTSTSVNNPVSLTGLATFAQASSDYVYSIDIPGVADALISGGQIDTSLTPWADWKNWLLAAHSGIQGCSKFNNLLTSFLGSTITNRSHRKALNRKSTESG